MNYRLKKIRQLKKSENWEKNINILGDADQIVQLLFILVDNALKYTDRNGSINITCKVDGNCVVLEITDTGIGIDNKDIEKIYDRFYRNETARQKNEEGSGLGLSIAKEIADKHNATIRVKSKKGKGTTFQITFKKNNLQ